MKKGILLGCLCLLGLIWMGSIGLADDSVYLFPAVALEDLEAEAVLPIRVHGRRAVDASTNTFFWRYLTADEYAEQPASDGVRGFTIVPETIADDEGNEYEVTHIAVEMAKGGRAVVYRRSGKDEALFLYKAELNAAGEAEDFARIRNAMINGKKDATMGYLFDDGEGWLPEDTLWFIAEENTYPRIRFYGDEDLESEDQQRWGIGELAGLDVGETALCMLTKERAWQTQDVGVPVTKVGVAEAGE